MAFSRFMAGPIGRLVRVIAGGGLMYWGWSMGSLTGWIVLAAGLVVLLAGALNFCLFGPLFGAPLRGSDLPRN
jgi:hypothetical protein